MSSDDVLPGLENNGLSYPNNVYIVYLCNNLCMFITFFEYCTTASGTLFSFLLGVRCHFFPISTGSLIIFALVYLTMPA